MFTQDIVTDIQRMQREVAKLERALSDSPSIRLLGILRLERDEWLKYSAKRKSEGSFEGWNQAQAVAEGLDRAIRIVVESIPPNAPMSLQGSQKG